MLSNILVNQSSRTKLELYLAQPSPVIALVGPSGSGKDFIAKILAKHLSGLETQVAVNKGILQIIEPIDGKKEISLESIRNLIKSISMKSVNKNSRRIVLITQAQHLTLEAQNALLKTLEQIPNETYFIATLDSINSVLPTIISRLQLIDIKPVQLAQAKSYFKDIGPKEVEAAWQLSKGLVGAMTSVLSEDASPLKISVEMAKHYLKLDRYSRVIYLDSKIKDKMTLADLLSGIARLLEALHHSAIKKQNLELQNRLLVSRKLVIKLRKQLLANSSQKLIALNLVNNLKV